MTRQLEPKACQFQNSAACPGDIWSCGLQPMEGILETRDLSRFRKNLALETWMVWQNSQLWPIPRCKLQNPRQTENRWARGGRMVWRLWLFADLLIISSYPLASFSRLEFNTVGGCWFVLMDVFMYFINVHKYINRCRLYEHFYEHLFICWTLLSMFITFDVALGRGQLATPLASLGPGDDGRG
jgi:hypothetical protein